MNTDDTPNYHCKPDSELTKRDEEILQQPSDRMVVAAAAAILNARGARRGMPPVANVLEIVSYEVREAAKDDAIAALREALAVAPWATVKIG